MDVASDTLSGLRPEVALSFQRANRRNLTGSKPERASRNTHLQRVPGWPSLHVDLGGVQTETRILAAERA